MSRNNNNRRGPRAAVGIKSQMGMLKSSLHGHANSLKAPSPPAFTRIPFNTIVVEDVLAMPTSDLSATSGSGNIYTQNIIECLKKQINLSASSTPAVSGASLIVKIQRIDLWSSTASSSPKAPTIRGKFYGLVQWPKVSGSGTEIIVNPIKILEDVGTQGADAAVVSYSWPRDQADMSLSDTQQVPAFFWQSSDASQQVVARYHLHWSTADNSSLITI